MSATTVVVEPPPPPPAVVATATTTATDTTPVPAPSSPTKQPQLNGVRSPTAAAVAATPEANGRAMTAPSEDVDMTPAGSEAAPEAPANGLTDAIKAEAPSAADAAPSGDPTPTPMEVDEPPVESNEAVPPEPEATTKIQSRAPEDDARALALAARRLELQIAFVENARKKIADESHPDFISRMVPIDAERERLVALATSQESYWTHCTSVIFAYECEEASSEFMMNCDKLRHEMLDEIHQEMEILNDQRKGSSSARKTTRKTRSARSKASAGSGGSGAGSDEKVFALDAAYTAQKAKKRVGNVFTHLENKLAQSEVDHDLRELHTSMDAVSKKRRMDATESPFVAKYHRANFLYRDAIFQEGDEIFVRNLMNGSEYIAVICSITSTELFVLSEKGKYFRLVFMDLRQGRVVVSAPSAEQTAALNEREALRI